jgi:fructokinase
MSPGADPAAFAAGWLAKGAKIVVVTKGAKGATAYSAQGHADVPAVVQKVADTVGAGDTFTAGLLTYLHRKNLLNKTALATLPLEELHNAINLAARAAAITVSRPGADPPWSRELA